MRPVPTARAPSGAEGAGPIAGGGLVTAKADEYLVEWTRFSLFVRKAPFSFGPSTARFLFGKIEKKMGGGFLR